MKLTPIASVATSRSCGPGSGAGTSPICRTSGPPNSLTVIARMTLFLPCRIVSPMSVDTKDSGASTPSVAAAPHAVAAVKKFVAEHGGSATAVIQPVGYAGVRITLVGADGVLGDQVVAD